MTFTRRWLFVVVLMAGIGALGWLQWRETSREKPAVSSGTSDSAQLDSFIRKIEIGNGTTPAPSLADFRARLSTIDSREALEWIQAYLDSGEDRSTGLSFVIGADGQLSEWPTIRTFLIDQLLALDPDKAAVISRGILDSPTTPDEWAICLRNVGRVEEVSGNHEYLRAKTEELIRNPEWMQSPSIGYLNAFDVLVHAGADESTPLLSELLQRKDRKDLAHAGFLTLDRLVQRKPAEILTRLSTDHALQQSRPEMVSQQFARADLREPDQKSIVRRWLLDPGRTPTELRSFASVYPNQNRFVSHNLLTSEIQTPAFADHDRAALEQIREWQVDPAFSSILDHLRAMEARLIEFTAEAPR